MAEITRHIGLSLGADICWPICYESLLQQLDLRIPHGDDTLRFEVDRVTIEPFALRQPVKYDVVLDRLTHWYYISREWLKKANLLDGVYILNNPWTQQSMEKQTTYCAMMRLGLPVPDTWMIPPKEYEEYDDLKPTLKRYARLFDLGEIGESLGYPLFMKPYDGGGWRGVNKIDDEATLRKTYDESGKLVMNLQAGVFPHDRFVRCIGLGPDVRFVSYDPGAPLHDRYRLETDFLEDDERRHLEDITLTINAFFGWDFNSCELLRKEGKWWAIDFANACPDSQVTSLHYHFPWLIMANLRWSIFCAATRRAMRVDLGWQDYFDIADTDRSDAEKLAEYARLSRERLEADRFAEFCATHLSHLDEQAYDFFGTEVARDAVRQKVEALFPENEHEEFTEFFWQRIQKWRDTEGKPA